MDATPPPAVVPVAAKPVTRPALKENGGLYLIAIFELVKTVLFLVAAAGVFHLLHHDTQVELAKLLRVFRISGDLRFVRLMLDKADLLDPYKVRIIVVLVVYAALHATEGLGLLLRKRWAEYFTITMTALPLPYEVYLVVHHTTHANLATLVPPGQRPEVIFGHWVLLKILVLIGNAAIVAYLVYHLYKGHGHGHAPPATETDEPTDPAGQPG